MNDGHETIEHMTRSYGIEIDKTFYISLWELAFNINNCWKAHFFYPYRYIKRFNVFHTGNNIPKGYYALETFELHRLVLAIRKWLKVRDYKIVGNDYYLKCDFK